jgi:PIN domain nuclease of toxin-antitoxin system
MRLLLDTHVLVWATMESHRLSSQARRLIADPDNDRFVSPATAYEIEFKRSRDAELGRMPMDLDDLRGPLVFDWLPIDEHHAVRAGKLPRHHGDPWDRLIVAQALAEDLVVVSIDPALARYGARTQW